MQEKRPKKINSKPIHRRIGVGLTSFFLIKLHREKAFQSLSCDLKGKVRRFQCKPFDTFINEVIKLTVPEYDSFKRQITMRLQVKSFYFPNQTHPKVKKLPINSASRTGEQQQDVQQNGRGKVDPQAKTPHTFHTDALKRQRATQHRTRIRYKQIICWVAMQSTGDKKEIKRMCVEPATVDFTTV